MDKKQAANSTYWWTGTDKEIISPPLDYSFMKADSFDETCQIRIYKQQEPDEHQSALPKIAIKQIPFGLVTIH